MQNKEVRSLPVPAYIQWAMRNLEKISPRLASSVSLYLFFRPIKFPIPDREKEIRNEGSIQWINTASGKLIKNFIYGESSPKKVLLIHGWSGRSSQFYRMIPELVAEGFEVHAPDGPAHGDSSGNKASLLEFEQLLEQMWENYGPYHALIGHSLGGIASLVAARNKEIPKVCIIGTPASITDIFHDFCVQLHLTSKVRDLMIRSVEKKYGLGIEDFSAEQVVKDLNTQGLVLHDENDVDVPIDSAHRIHKNWNGSELFLTSGLGHRRILAQKKVIRHVADFIDGNK